jgi:MacB-like periplasmic core domain
MWKTSRRANEGCIDQRCAVRLTPSIFLMLGVQPIVGRMFTETEGQAGGPAVVMLSEGLWRNTFKADPNIVGRSVRIGGVGHAVVGVMPYSMSFPEETGPDLQKGVWLPLQPTPEMLSLKSRTKPNALVQLDPRS